MIHLVTAFIGINLEEEEEEGGGWNTTPPRSL